MVSIGPLPAIRAADELYSNRSEPASGRAVISELGRIRNGESLFDVQWRLARAMFLAGQDEPHLFRKGSRHGLKAASLDPKAVEGHFWAGVDLALAAEQIGGISGALLVLKARRSLRRAVSISASYHGAGPLRVLARLCHKAPWFLGGSLSASQRCYDRAIELAPNNPVTLMYAAELALDLGERIGAIRLLEKITALAPDPEWKLELDRDKNQARVMLESLNAPTGVEQRVRQAG
ncbi:MAG: TRAP transporter TatT component family protein [Blastocatellia bacterium]